MSSALFNLSRENAFRTMSGLKVGGRLSSVFITILVCKNKEVSSLGMQLSPGPQHSNNLSLEAKG